jgi:dihydroorotate dehydrogenase electron transfer subunit
VSVRDEDRAAAPCAEDRAAAARDEDRAAAPRAEDRAAGARDEDRPAAPRGSSPDDRTLAPLGRRRLPVAGRREYGAYVVLSVADADGPAPDPGQFVMLAAVERWGGGADERPFLPRAFSVARRHEDGTLDFVLEDVGPGTERLAELDRGDEVWLLGPLGRGFDRPREGRRPVLVGGGVGIAPLAIWQDALGATALVLLGFRDAAHAEGARLLSGARLATDDGSRGHHGLVTELLAAEIGSGVEVYACGPPPMLEAVRALCAEHDVPAQLALESGMACGFGACFGCVVPTRDGYVRLCVDGPVLDAADLEVVEDPGHARAER